MRKFFLALVAVLLIPGVLVAPSWLQYKQAGGVVPPGVRLAGMDFEATDEAGVIAALERQFSEPIAVFYSGQRVILRPQVVDFKIDVPAMIAEAQTHANAPQMLRYFLGELIDRPAPSIDVPLRYSLNSDALDNWLADLATRYDRPPFPPQPVLDSLSIAPGEPGYQLDLPASRARVIAALTDPTTRSADLAVREAPAPPIDIQALTRLLERRLEQFPNIAGLFLHHVGTGDEVAIGADVAFAGMSTLKIPILVELYRKLDGPPDALTTRAITETTSSSGNFTANVLLGIVGDGDAQAGARILTESMRTLGLKNTFMAVPYDHTGAAPPRIITEANSRTDLNTQPDPYIQTTARDMGLMLAMIVDCSQNGGTLLAAYPGELTPEECSEALDFLALNEVHELLTAGVPEGTRVVHKHGYVSDSHGDVAAIWGPAGPYVLSLFLYDPPWLEWNLSSGTMRDVSTAVWNYFTLVAEQTQPDENEDTG